MFSGKSTADDTTLYTFVNPELPFPAKITYRRTAGGMMFAQLDGKVSGVDRQVIYPYKPVDCLTGKGP